MLGGRVGFFPRTTIITGSSISPTAGISATSISSAIVNNAQYNILSTVPSTATPTNTNLLYASQITSLVDPSYPGTRASISNLTDTSKRLNLDVLDSSTTGTTTTLVSNQSANRRIFLPDADGTLLVSGAPPAGAIRETKKYSSANSFQPAFTVSGVLTSPVPSTTGDVRIYEVTGISMNLGEFIQILFSVNFNNADVPARSQQFVQLSMYKSLPGPTELLDVVTVDLTSPAGPDYFNSVKMSGWYTASATALHTVIIYAKIWDPNNDIRFLNAQLVYNIFSAASVQSASTLDLA